MSSSSSSSSSDDSSDDDLPSPVAGNDDMTFGNPFAQVTFEVRASSSLSLPPSCLSFNPFLSLSLSLFLSPSLSPSPPSLSLFLFTIVPLSLLFQELGDGSKELDNIIASSLQQLESARAFYEQMQARVKKSDN